MFNKESRLLCLLFPWLTLPLSPLPASLAPPQTLPYDLFREYRLVWVGEQPYPQEFLSTQAAVLVIGLDIGCGEQGFLSVTFSAISLVNRAQGVCPALPILDTELIRLG